MDRARTLALPAASRATVANAQPVYRDVADALPVAPGSTRATAFPSQPLHAVADPYESGAVMAWLSPVPSDMAMAHPIELLPVSAMASPAPVPPAVAVARPLFLCIRFPGLPVFLIALAGESAMPNAFKALALCRFQAV
jgi:hypothetical protein